MKQRAGHHDWGPCAQPAEHSGYQQQPRICQGYWLGLGELGSTELKPGARQQPEINLCNRKTATAGMQKTYGSPEIRTQDQSVKSRMLYR